ncbi:MAG: DUF1295 domain-containing protein [Marinilabiliales bacterium]|nr:DUF1295 domain-containing protein [Marinilabiliales bacterium]
MATTTLFSLFLKALPLVLVLMTLVWLVSIPLRNVSIVDSFWGIGFVVLVTYYSLFSEGNDSRKLLMQILVTLWGLRLSLYLSWRNWGKGEDFRYQEFRKQYGAERYWWISFFQTFLLQGILMWLISSTLLGTMWGESSSHLNGLDYLGIGVWLIGFYFEVVGDLQLARFKSRPENKCKVLNSGLWKFTRHPNYFGDAAVWSGYALICLAAGNYYSILGSVLMILLIIKVSGVALLERTLVETKPAYREYIEKTSSFLPWIPKK